MKIKTGGIILVTFIVIISLVSCKSDDNNVEDISKDLLGMWQRSDVSQEFEFTLIFEEELTGIKMEREGILGDEGTSSAVTFNWNIDNELLILDFDGSIINTSFFINSNGQLILSDYSPHPFNKL